MALVTLALAACGGGREPEPEAPRNTTLDARINVSADSTFGSLAPVRSASTTPTGNDEQRRIPLTFIAGAGNNDPLSIPAHPGGVLPGHHRLFAMNTDSVPPISRSKWLSADQRLAGAQLFDGRTPLVARLSGHATVLPSLATRCTNCHALVAPGDASAFGGSINAASLTALRSRRNGPPSRFDEASLCRLLRTGVDPVHVLVPTTMPRYDITDDECKQLWTHLSQT